MKFGKILVVLGFTLWISGCAAYTPFGNIVVPGGVEVGDGGGGHGHGGGFCPPGQAKKGNC
jgi:hypothetical protein